MSLNPAAVTAPTLAELLTSEPITTTLVGVEREYRLLGGGTLPLDFRSLISTLSIPGRGLDPGDPNAHHLPSGVMLTADGPEAEIATPPLPVEPGFTGHVTSWSQLAEDTLLVMLPAGTTIEGYSTHVNVSVGGDVVAIADLFARHFAAAMALLLDQTDSPGLLVRPRPGRLELGGDFVDGEQLRAAVTFAVAAPRRCTAAVTLQAHVELPTPRRTDVESAHERPGWFVPADPQGGRDALLESWSVIRDELEGIVDLAELGVVDQIADGRRPIPREEVTGPDRQSVQRRSPFADLHARERGDLRVRVHAMSWAAVAFIAVADERECHVVVPRRWLPSFLEQLDAGALDDVIASAPSQPFGSGPRVVRGPFDAACVLPREPSVPGSRWPLYAPEIVGALVGIAAVAGVYRFWPW